MPTWNPPSTRGRALLAVLPAFALFAVHAAVFGAWVVDDAGISFAYARNLAAGEGLVAQPGAAPVEGFTNALWTLLLAATDAAGLFHPVLTPKLLAALLVLGAFLLLSRELVAGHGRSAVAVGLALAATAAATPFVVWTVSGLENPLTVFLLSALVAGCLRAGRRRAVERRDAAVLGALCCALVLTRPDGIVFVPVVAFLLAAGGGGGRSPARRWAPLLAGSFLVPWLLVTAGRLVYFGDVLPNPYYAKEGPGWEETLWLLDHLGTAAGGAVVVVEVVLVVLLSVLLAVWLAGRLRRRLEGRPALLVLAVFFVSAYAIYELLPTDWMPEYRFATPLFLLAPLLLVELVGAIPVPGGQRRRRAWVLGAAVASLLAAGLYAARHTPDFRSRPTVPFDDVRRLSVELERVAAGRGVERAVVLLPDVGGSLWEDRFEVLDLAGLTDRTIGRTLGKDRGAFLDHVLSRRPDLVWVHGYWRTLTDFESVPGFTERYVAVPPGETLGRDDGALFVRRALASDG